MELPNHARVRSLLHTNRTITQRARHPLQSSDSFSLINRKCPVAFSRIHKRLRHISIDPWPEPLICMPSRYRSEHLQDDKRADLASTRGLQDNK